MQILRAAGLLAATLTLSACMVRVPVSQQPPPRYATASPYAAPGAYRPVDPYCAEAAAVAEDQAMRADATGRGRDIRRAERTEHYARRDCR